MSDQDSVPPQDLSPQGLWQRRFEGLPEELREAFRLVSEGKKRAGLALREAYGEVGKHAGEQSSSVVQDARDVILASVEFYAWARLMDVFDQLHDMGPALLEKMTDEDGTVDTFDAVVRRALKLQLLIELKRLTLPPKGFRPDGGSSYWYYLVSEYHRFALARWWDNLPEPLKAIAHGQ